MTKVQRYKVGYWYYTDECGMPSITPCLIPDDSGFAVKFEDYFKLEAENERLEAELTKYLDAPVVAWQSPRNGFICKENKNPEYNKPLMVKPGEEK